MKALLIDSYNKGVAIQALLGTLAEQPIVEWEIYLEQLKELIESKQGCGYLVYNQSLTECHLLLTDRVELKHHFDGCCPISEVTELLTLDCLVDCVSTATEAEESFESTREKLAVDLLNDLNVTVNSASIKNTTKVIDLAFRGYFENFPKIYERLQ